MTQSDSVLREFEVPRPVYSSGLASPQPSGRPHLDARTTGWLIEQRAQIKKLELDAAALQGELETSSRIERGAQRFCDRLEDELEKSRKREATLARALGYAEAQRDQLATRLAEPEAARTSGKRRLGWRRK